MAKIWHKINCLEKFSWRICRIWVFIWLIIISFESDFRWFNAFSESDFARSGDIATETITLDAGPLKQFPHSLEPQLRDLGLPTTLQKGIVTLTNDHVVCKDGETLTSEQARILVCQQWFLCIFSINSFIFIFIRNF